MSRNRCCLHCSVFFAGQLLGQPVAACSTCRTTARPCCPSALQVEQAQQELERRQAVAEAQAEELAARERSLRRQEDGLEGLKVGRSSYAGYSHCCIVRNCGCFEWQLPPDLSGACAEMQCCFRASAQRPRAAVHVVQPSDLRHFCGRRRTSGWMLGRPRRARLRPTWLMPEQRPR